MSVVIWLNLLYMEESIKSCGLGKCLGAINCFLSGNHQASDINLSFKGGIEMEAVSLWTLVASALGILAGSSFVFWYQHQSKYLPKGNWSLPIVGETFKLRREGIQEFIRNHTARYGDLFSTTIMGRTTVCVSNPEAIKFVLSTAHSSFPEGFGMQHFRLTSQGVFRGPGHPHFRRIILQATTGESLQSMLPFISSTAKKVVDAWENKESVHVCSEMTKYTFTVMMHVLWSDIEPDSAEMAKIRETMGMITQGIISMPINLPGFTFYKALKAREYLVKKLMTTMKTRRKDGVNVGDVLGAHMVIDQFKVSDYEISCVMIAFMFAGYITTATLLPWAMKYLHENPRVLQHVQDEQEEVRQKMVEDGSLKWFKSRSSMPFTSQVIDEVLRLESIVTVVPRRAETNVEYNGFVFPKDVYVWLSTYSLHWNPKYFPNPSVFDPSRFKETPKPNTYMPFGNGPHMCPGSELARVEALFLLHHLVTKFSWESLAYKQSKARGPLRQPAGGYPIRVKKVIP